MIIDIATLFDEMMEGFLSESIIGRARKSGAIEIRCWNIRDFTTDKHKKVDDIPYGGGMGMVMQPDPIFRCYEEICAVRQNKPYVVYMSPQGNVLSQKKAAELSEISHLMILCGHYEGVDERVIQEIVDEEISIGDYVLTGGELAALVVVDTISRLCDGVLASSVCFEEESHYNGLLEYPHYTRPYDWHGKKVPEVLISGHHANIEKFRKNQSLIRTLKKRPDMLEHAELSPKEKEFVEHYKEFGEN